MPTCKRRRGAIAKLKPACGGSDMKRWLPLIDQIETYARAEGCRRVSIFGRKGWLHVIMNKELD
jgi:hypothetical protein